MITPNDPTSAPPASVTPFPTTDLHVYRIEHDGDRYWYAARDAAAALTAWLDDMGMTMSDVRDTGKPPIVTAISDDYRLTIHRLSDPDGEDGEDYDDETDVQTKTCREWCAVWGEGMLCTNVDF